MFRVVAVIAAFAVCGGLAGFFLGLIPVAPLSVIAAYLMVRATRVEHNNSADAIPVLGLIIAALISLSLFIVAMWVAYLAANIGTDPASLVAEHGWTALFWRP
jgi:hypothetical protein